MAEALSGEIHPQSSGIRRTTEKSAEYLDIGSSTMKPVPGASRRGPSLSTSAYNNYLEIQA
jgi:hypothetical protein